jgi:hypothetical protein
MRTAPWRRRPHQTKEARRVESASFLRGYYPREALEAIRDCERRYIAALNKNAACPREPAGVREVIFRTC